MRTVKAESIQHAVELGLSSLQPGLDLVHFQL